MAETEYTIQRLNALKAELDIHANHARMIASGKDLYHCNGYEVDSLVSDALGKLKDEWSLVPTINRRRFLKSNPELRGRLRGIRSVSANGRHSANQETVEAAEAAS